VTRGVSRRTFVAGALAVPTLGVGAAWGRADACAAESALLYDPTLAAARAFAAHAHKLGGVATQVGRDRVRLVKAMLAARPRAIWGVTRPALLHVVADGARTSGYQAVAVFPPGEDCGPLPSCMVGAEAIATLARLAGGSWPALFAELAIGGAPGVPPTPFAARADPAVGWVLARRGGPVSA